jgi:hypothetical protein
VPEWPSHQEFVVRDRKTDLVHVAREYEQPGIYDSIVEHSTWCGIAVDRRDFLLVDDGAHLTCLACATRTLYTWHPAEWVAHQEVGVGIINTRAIKKLDLDLTNPCGEIPVGTAQTSGLAGDIVSVVVGGKPTS